MAHLSLSLLGPFRAELDRTPLVGFRSVKNQALLAYLALDASRAYARTTLAGLLWPDESEDRARLNLRQAIFQLRSVLSPSGSESASYLQSTGQTLQFDTNKPHLVDAVLFTQLLTECSTHAHPALDRCAACAARLTNAVALVQGEFLEGLFIDDSSPLEEWILWQREQFQRQVLDALETLARWHESQEEYELAYRYAQRQLTIDSLREEAYRQAMRALALRGQIEAALAHYDQCRRVLKKELESEPSSETRHLFAQIKQGTLVVASAKASVVATEVETSVAGTDTLPGDNGLTRISGPISGLISGHTTSPAIRIVSRHNLPAALNSFVGRQPELTDLRSRLLDPTCRLVSLTGPGGIGKTRLALEVVRTLLEQTLTGPSTSAHVALRASYFPDGIWHIALVAATTVEAMALTILRTLGAVIQEKIEPQRQLFDYLQLRQVLLVLDNFEQLAEESHVLGDLLAHAEQVKLLVTSRFRLRLQAEHVVDLSGLPIPNKPNHKQAQSFGSVQLFVERARQTWSRFRLDSNRGDVIKLCQLLEGLPLGIELAAGWADQVSCAEMVRMIRQSYDSLASTLRDTPVRQRSLRAVFESSWSLLKPEEQQALACLTLMVGNFDEQAALNIGSTTQAILTALTYKSLVRLNGKRYQLHEMVREFAREKLERWEGERVKVEANLRYCHYYLGLLAAERTALIGTNPGQVAARLQFDLNNIRQAWRWATDSRLATELNASLSALGDLYDLSGLFREAASVFQTTLDQVKPDLAVTQATTTAANIEADIETRIDLYAELHLQLMRFLNQLGRPSETLVLGDQALGLAETSNRPDLLPTVLRLVGAARFQLGKPDEALQLYEDAVELTSTFATGDAAQRRLWADTRFTLGDALMYQSDQRAEELLRGALVVYRQIGDQRNEAWLLNSLGVTTSIQRHYEQARTYLETAVQICRQLGDRAREVRVLNNLALLHAFTPDYEQSNRYLRQALQVSEEVGMRSSVMVALTNIGSNQMEQNYLTEARASFEQALDHARAIGDIRSEGALLNNLGNVLRLEGDPTTAERLLRQSIPLAQQYNELHFLTTRWKNLGLALRDQKREVEATTAFNQALEVCRQINDAMTESDVLIELGKLAAARGEVRSARQLWQQALEIAVRCENKGGEEEARGLMEG